ATAPSAEGNDTPAPSEALPAAGPSSEVMGTITRPAPQTTPAAPPAGASGETPDWFSQITPPGDAAQKAGAPATKADSVIPPPAPASAATQVLAGMLLLAAVGGFAVVGVLVWRSWPRAATPTSAVIAQVNGSERESPTPPDTSRKEPPTPPTNIAPPLQTRRED